MLACGIKNKRAKMVTSARINNNNPSVSTKGSGRSAGGVQPRPASFASQDPAVTAKHAGKKPSRDNERPLVEDIRLLGRILGDVIREQEGVAAYELIEQVRKLSVAFRRDADQEGPRS